MVHEKSSGVIVFRIDPRDGLQYLVLYHRGSYWNFPKGKIEGNETEKENAVRELEEETGIAGVKLIDGWRQKTDFFFKEDRNGKKELIKKDFIIFLAPLKDNQKVKLSYEHNGYAWFDFKTAFKYLKFKSLKEILKEADSFVNSKIKLAKQEKQKK